LSLPPPTVPLVRLSASAPPMVTLWPSTTRP